MARVEKQCAQLGMAQPGFATRAVKLNTCKHLMSMAVSPSCACARRSNSFFAGGDEDGCVAAVYNVAGNTPGSLRLRNGQCRAVKPKALRCEGHDGLHEAKLIQDHYLGKDRACRTSTSF